ncbi:L,D-transpeptidase [Streptomyces sp. AC563]|uniref:L,D-transpeptidase n=1 Tax=Streptomyces buecherae TaxID=2763006 RepID=UPI00164D524A|nr:Ig-like domain-containing protein [Streptomyces buecherae]MBC3986058.1 L,D-transpeptidase [Streptomyces buecherae]MBC3987426.1 L,D-transpeptidase [Streptomyces buecherae]QNJ43307.1 L,D-transpeptidase [Streptomyces buecherae]
MLHVRRPQYRTSLQRRRTAALAGTAALAAAALTACSSADANTASDKPATVAVNLSGSQVKAGEQVKVTARGGKLTEVTVADTKGTKLTGRLAEDGSSWTSDRKTAPGASYTVTVQSKGDGGAKDSKTSSFRTVAADKVNKLDWRPGAKSTVGVAQPISLVFDHPVKNKAEVEKQLKVETSNNTEGSWGWMQDWSGKDRVDWRPREYWQPGTKVKLKAQLAGVDSGEGGWFVRDYATDFTVGERQVVSVDLDTKQLTLTRGGQRVRTIPISGGTPGGDKASWRGTTVLMSKEGTINMNSETVGLGNSYNKMVDYSMRLSWSGTYAHAAPWNAAYFGRANHSSGCIGMSDADAAALYGQVRVGDPFEIKGQETKGLIAPNNGFGEWNLSWDAWQAKSALRG